jgi:hypothetical protein
MLRIGDHVTVTHVPGQEGDKDNIYGHVLVEWESSPLADCTADTIVAVLLQEQGEPAAVGAAEDERKCALTSLVL